MRQKRVVVTEYGGPEVITVIEEEFPTPKPGEVRVKVLAAGVSLPDVLAREGVHPETPRVPYTPGWDLVGTVDQRGAGVTGFELRQPVAAMPIHGCYAQYVCLPNASLSPCLRVGRRAGARGRRGVELHHRVSDAASIGEGPARTAYVDPRGLGSCRHAMLQLAQLAGVEIYGTCSGQGTAVVRELGGIPSITRTRIS
jgi:NADPH:quinone reductase